MQIKELVAEANDVEQPDHWIFGVSCTNMPYEHGDELRDQFFAGELEFTKCEIKLPNSKLKTDTIWSVIRSLPKLNILKIWNHSVNHTLFSSPYYQNIRYILEQTQPVELRLTDQLDPEYVYTNDDLDRIQYTISLYQKQFVEFSYTRKNEKK